MRCAVRPSPRVGQYACCTDEVLCATRSADAAHSTSALNSSVNMSAAYSTWTGMCVRSVSGGGGANSELSPWSGPAVPWTEGSMDWTWTGRVGSWTDGVVSLTAVLLIAEENHERFT
eukprot:2929388-Rhodomonas_salina.1